MESNCQVCGSNNWIALPDPNSSQSVTTAGRIVQQPLGKSQCAVCGFAQRVRASFLGFTDYYEQDYANYYERPGTEKYHFNRYKVMIDWMTSHIVKDHVVNTVLDIGCGQGWAMQAFAEYYPKAEITGLEPSHFNVKRAREKGLTVHEVKLENANLKPGSFDLVYSNNVIQHVNNAESFLKDLQKLIKPDGVIIVTCPNGALPNIEILWADQNFSFLPQHLISIAEKLNFNISYWASSPSNSSLPPAQLLILTNNEKYIKYKGQSSYADTHLDIKKILGDRTAYLGGFAKLNDYLFAQIKDSESVYNFGASYWTSVLAAYCPGYWQKVKKIVLDEPSDMDSFLGKEIIQASEVPQKDTIVLGIAPASHNVLKEKLKKSWKQVITWDSLVNY